MSLTDFLIWSGGALVAFIIFSVIFTKSREYGMRIFLSKEFAMMFFGALFAIAACFAIQPEETGIITGAVIGTGIFIIAMLRNIKKSTPAFGIVFTVFQTLMLACFFLIVFAIFGMMNQNKRSA